MKGDRDDTHDGRRIDRIDATQRLDGRWVGRAWIDCDDGLGIRETSLENALSFLSREDALDHARTVATWEIIDGSGDEMNEVMRALPDVVDGITDGKEWIARATHSLSRSDYPWGIGFRGGDSFYLLTSYASPAPRDQVERDAVAWVRSR